MMGLGFTIPNEAAATAAGYTEQADIDSVDFYIMQQGLAGYGVVSGCQVTAQATPDMTVTVSPGIVNEGPQRLNVAGGTTSALSASPTFTKYVLIVVNASGQVARLLGAAAANPIFPTPTPGTVVLAAVTVPANATSIANEQIVDKRMFLNTSTSTGSKLYLSSIDTTRMRP